MSALEVAAALRRARARLARGWHPALSLDDEGVIAVDLERARRWCIDDALAHGSTIDAMLAARALVEALVAVPLPRWEEHAVRTQREVIVLIDRAVVRASVLANNSHD